MSILDWLSPEKSTAAWAAKLFKGICKENWEHARENKQDIFKEMLNWRKGTPSSVLQNVDRGLIQSLSRLCTEILISEAIQVNPSDIPQIEQRMKKLLSEKGIPIDLC